MDASQLFWLAPAGSLLALAFSYYFYSENKKYNNEYTNEKSLKITEYIEEGTKSYLTTQYKVVGLFFIIIFAIFAFLSFVLETLNPWMPIAFLTGGLLSAIISYIGIKVTSKSCIYTIFSAQTSLNSALQAAIRSGSTLSFLVVGLGLLDISIWWKILNYVLNNQEIFRESIFIINSYTEITNIMLSFGIGAISLTLFAKIGGGIFTNAAKFSVYLLNKGEADISENDLHNPAIIADNVGNNVCDAIGSTAEFYDTLIISILAAMTLGASTFSSEELSAYQLNSIFLPLALAGVGIVFSIFGIYNIKVNENATPRDLLKSINRGSSFAAFFTAIGSIALVNSLLPHHIQILASIIIGLMAGITIGWSTNYYTSEEYDPTSQLLAHSSEGSATLIIEGLANGLQSTLIPAVTIGLTVLLAYGFAGGFSNTSMGLYGIAMAAIGMISTLTINITHAVFAPIVNNAAKNAAMSENTEETQKRINSLNSIGKVIASTGKGISVCSAVLTSLALISAYFEEIRQSLLYIANFSGKELSKYVYPNPTTQIPIEKATISDFLGYYNMNIMNPIFILGIFLGIIIVLTFCALTLKAVYIAGKKTVEEVKRQFKDIPGLLKGENKADYASCVSVASYCIQKDMITPIAIVIIVPAITGILLGPSAIIGMLLGGITTGFAFGTVIFNASGSWINANKHVENGECGGKGSETHKITILSSNLGHPLVDVAGASLNTIIKFLCMISIVFVGATINYSPAIQETIGLSPSEIVYPKEFAKANGMNDYEDMTYSSQNNSSIYEDPLLGTEDIILPTDESLLRPKNKKTTTANDIKPTPKQEKDTSTTTKPQDSFTSGFNNQNESKSSQVTNTSTSNGFGSDFGGGFDSFDSNTSKTENKTESSTSNSGFDSGFGGGFDSFDSNTSKTENKTESSTSNSGFDSGFGGGFDTFDSNTSKTENKTESSTSNTGFDSGFEGGFDSFDNNTSKAENKTESSASNPGFDNGFEGGFDSLDSNAPKTENKTENTASNEKPEETIDSTEKAVTTLQTEPETNSDNDKIEQNLLQEKALSVNNDNNNASESAVIQQATEKETNQEEPKNSTNTYLPESKDQKPLDTEITNQPKPEPTPSNNSFDSGFDAF